MFFLNTFIKFLIPEKAHAKPIGSPPLAERLEGKTSHERVRDSRVAEGIGGILFRQPGFYLIINQGSYRSQEHARPTL